MSDLYPALILTISGVIGFAIGSYWWMRWTFRSERLNSPTRQKILALCDELDARRVREEELENE